MIVLDLETVPNVALDLAAQMCRDEDPARRVWVWHGALWRVEMSCGTAGLGQASLGSA